MGLATSLAAGCASLQPRLELKSKPLGAEVSTLSGDKLGATPLVFSADKLSALATDGRIGLLIEAQGHMPGVYFFELHGDDVHEVVLVKLDREYFVNRLVKKDYMEQANELVRSGLMIQALILNKRLGEAEKLLMEFQKAYPNLAAGYALQANIEIARNNSVRARELLERANALDPGDSAVARALGRQPLERSAP